MSVLTQMGFVDKRKINIGRLFLLITDTFSFLIIVNSPPYVLKRGCHVTADCVQTGSFGLTTCCRLILQTALKKSNTFVDLGPALLLSSFLLAT